MNREELERREFEEAFKEFDKVRKRREHVRIDDVRGRGCKAGKEFCYAELVAK